jgi:hypothetical protein
VRSVGPPDDQNPVRDQGHGRVPSPNAEEANRSEPHAISRGQDRSVELRRRPASDHDRASAERDGGEICASLWEHPDDRPRGTTEPLDGSDGCDVAATEYQLAIAADGTRGIVDGDGKPAGVGLMPGRRVDRQDASETPVAREATGQDDRLAFHEGHHPAHGNG